MGFTVTHQGGTTDAAFQTYARLLRQHGVDLGRSPRVPEPHTRGRWLPVWKSRAEAQAFAQELRERTQDQSWEVAEVESPVSEGPLGPVLIQLARQADGLTFAVHPLSRATIRSAFPGAVGTTHVFVDAQAWDDFQKTRGSLGDLVRQIAPSLTGLSEAQLDTLGYAVIDADTQETLVSVLPTEVVQD